MSEIMKRAAEERALYEKLGHNEPDNLASGDMKKFLEAADSDCARAVPEGQEGWNLPGESAL